MSSTEKSPGAITKQGGGPHWCVLVPLDLGLEADQALPVGAVLARAFDIELDVVCITSPLVDPMVDDEEARRHARPPGS